MRSECAKAITMAALLSITARSAESQRLSGVVRSASDSATISSALVELRDSADNVIARQLSTSRGTFLFTLPQPGRYAVDVRRIGFNRSKGRPMLVRADAAIVVALDAVAMVLPEVTARELNRCRSDADRGSVTSRLWESAVISMLSAVATVSDSSLVFDIMPSVRTYTVPDAIFVDIALRDARVADAQPWTSLPAAELAEFGYVRLVGNALEFVAPDVDVLSSEEFLASHCLQVRDDRLSEGIIGVAFAPSERVTRADIQGVLWIDRDSQELQTIEFSYAAMPLAVADSLAGGRVDIVRLEGGGWMPSQWTVRSPVPTRSFVDAVAYRGEDLRRAGLPVGVRDVDPPLMAERLQVTGATVQRVRRIVDGDSTVIWRRTPASVEVTAQWMEDGNAIPAPQATVRLSGSRREGVANRMGRVTFAELPGGDYFVEAQTPIESALRLPSRRTPVRVAEGSQESLRVLVLSPLAAIEVACGSTHTGGVLAGRVTQSGRAQANVLVSASVTAPGAAGETTARSLGSVRTDSLGRYFMCSVPRAAELTLSARGADKSLTVIDASLPESSDDSAEYVTFVDVTLPTPRNRDVDHEYHVGSIANNSAPKHLPPAIHASLQQTRP